MEKVILDIREKDEFKNEHIEGSLHVPLSEWGVASHNLINKLKDKPLVIMCRTGRRAEILGEQLKNFPQLNYEIYEGGIEKWKKQGGQVVTISSTPLPIMRQVQIGAGTLVLLGLALTATVSVWFLGLVAFVGAGLVFAGFTGFCAMAKFLAKMPWNQTKDNPKLS